MQFQKYFSLRVFLLIIFFLLLIKMQDHVRTILLIFIFLVLGVITVHLGRFIPNANIEVVSIFAILIGYTYGPKEGIIFGLIGGGFSYLVTGIISIYSITMVILISICGLLGYLFSSFNVTLAGMTAITLFNMLKFLFFSVLSPNLSRNIIYSSTHTLFGIALFISFGNFLHALL